MSHDSEDVFDVAQAVWCQLCGEQHLPCEMNADGADAGVPDPDGYCGCCGRSISDVGGDTWWCLDCLNHLNPAPTHQWDRTYYAQHGQPCPLQI